MGGTGNNGDGGGLYNEAGHVVASDAGFSRNHAVGGAGGHGGSGGIGLTTGKKGPTGHSGMAIGGGVDNEGATASLILKDDSTFTLNSAFVDGDGSALGGGLVNSLKASLTVTGGTFSGNDALTTHGGNARGGALFIDSGGTLDGTSVTDNFAEAVAADGIPAGEGVGGGLYIIGPAVVLKKATVSGNHASTSDDNIHGPTVDK
jgi:hypothetical protein